MFKFKKGVSPIIAAVLLVVITIAIGATTMAFIRSLSDQNLASAQEKTERIACGTDVSFSIVAISDEYKICKGTDYLEASIRNTGSRAIKDFRLVALGDNISTVEENRASNLAIDSYSTMNITYTAENVSEFVIEPIIQGQPGQDIICSDSALTWQAVNIENC
ncbi:hypothetical protein C0585_01150 [Candidatus Woesearchaeota archaeon]|nr:MAG: hypothetical protein C0585_01150 [Candidatus Woesearchaeota archaeon]